MFRSKTNLFSFLFTVITFAAAANAQNATTYVAPNSGSDLNTCVATSQCQTVQKALSVTNAGGAVILTQNANYETFSVDKRVTIAGADGIHATVTTDNANFDGAFVSNLTAQDTVVFRNIHFVGLANQAGIVVTQNGMIAIENCSFTGLGSGIAMSAGRAIFIHNSTFRNNGTGIDITGAGPEATRVTIDSSAFESNQYGVRLTNKINAVIRNSTVTNSSIIGIWATSKEMALPGELLIDNCQVHQNPVGISAAVTGRGSQLVRLSRSTITDSATAGVSLTAATTLYTLGDNVFGGNFNDVVGSGTFTSLAKK